MTSNNRQIRLGAFLPGAGQHIAAWRHPQAASESVLDIGYYQRLVSTAERGLFDLFFLADGLSLPRRGSAFGRTSFGVVFEPVTLYASLSAITRHIGFVATASTTYEDPFLLARKFASLDHLSNGRAAWNLVTTEGAEAAGNFGLAEHPPHAQRYEKAEEFYDVVTGLWDTWDDDALVIDRESGHFIDPDKVRSLDHEGRFFKVKGPLNIPRPVQGHPVVVQAGSSEPGKELAARTAEVIFTAQQTLEDAQAFYRDVKGRLAKYGREPDQLRIMPGVQPYVARTEEEARAKYRELEDLIHPEIGLGLLSGLTGGQVDLSQLDPDGPLPELPETNGNKSRQSLVYALARDQKLTIRELYKRVAGARGHWTIVGTPRTIADRLQEWFENGAADGFNIMPPLLPRDIDDFVDLVVPELQRRGLFRTEYEGATLRENLGLARPSVSRRVLRRVSLAGGRLS